MQFSFYVGIDVSKNSLDLAIRDQQQVLFHISVENNEAGLDQFKAQCQDNDIDLTRSLFCCEHTGIYSQVLLTFATQHDIPLWRPPRGWNPLCALNAPWDYNGARAIK